MAGEPIDDEILTKHGKAVRQLVLERLPPGSVCVAYIGVLVPNGPDPNTVWAAGYLSPLECDYPLAMLSLQKMSEMAGLAAEDIQQQSDLMLAAPLGGKQ